MKRAWVWPAALLAVAVVTSVVHTEPVWQTARVGPSNEWLVLEGDVHVHTSFAGALATPVDVPLLARRRALDFVCVTEHNSWHGAWLTSIAGELLAPDVVVLPSEEVTNRAYHALAIGTDGRVDPTLPLSEIADDVHRRGGVLLAAHPTRETWPLLLGLADEKKLDGAELFHPTILRDPSGAVAREYAEFLDEASRRSGRRLVAAGSSDFHGGGSLGVLRTLVLATARSPAAILAAMRAGRVVAVRDDGALAGDEASMALLRQSTYQVRTSGHMPGAAWAERALAWTCAIVLVLALGRRSARRQARSAG